MTEIDIASDQEHAERGGTAATDLQLESEQRATQASAARTAREADGQSVPLPHCRSIVTCLGMADGEACNFQQANEPSRPHISLAGEEQALHGSFFVDIPDEINRVHIGDLLRMSEAFAAPLCEEWTPVKNRNSSCGNLCWPHWTQVVAYHCLSPQEGAQRYQALPAEEDSASDAAGSAERSPRLALSVPVGLAEEATEDEDMAAEPNHAFGKFFSTSTDAVWAWCPGHR